MDIAILSYDSPWRRACSQSYLILLIVLIMFGKVTGALNWIVRTSTDLETNIVSVERVNEYCELESEVGCVSLKDE